MAAAITLHHLHHQLLLAPKTHLRSVTLRPKWCALVEQIPTQVALSLIFALTCLTLGQRIMMEIPVPCLALSCAIMLTMKCGVPVDPTMVVTLQVTVCQEAKMKMAAGLVVQ